MEERSASRGSGMTAFGFYLRTGRRMVPQPPIEVKFNPYHDPKDGRFTFKSGGSSGYGGGGATGGWTGPTPKPRPRIAKPPKLPQQRQQVYSVKTGDSPSRIAGLQDGVTAADIAEVNGIDINATLNVGQTLKLPIKAQVDAFNAANDALGGRAISKNGYKFFLDAAGRTKVVTGSIRLDPDQVRSRTNQAKAGGTDRLSTDEGGHYIARRFGGPTDAFNHFAQDRRFNRRDYQALENKWSKATDAGERVWVRIEPQYRGSSIRPSFLSVVYTIGNSRFKESFSNRGEN